MPTNLRPLTTGELLDQTFTLYRRNFRLFLAITSGPYVALLICQFALRVPVEISSRRILLPFSSRGFVLFMGEIIAGCIAHGAITHAVSALRLGRPVTPGSAYAAIQSQVGVLFIISIILSLGFLVGILLLLIPTFLIVTRYSLSTSALVIERLGVVSALKRSNQLSKGSKGRVLLIYGLFLAAFISTGIATNRLTTLFFGSYRSSAPMAVIFRTLATWAHDVLLSPVISTAMTLLYYDQRVRKEGFDLEHMMLELTGGRTTAAFS